MAKASQSQKGGSTSPKGIVEFSEKLEATKKLLDVYGSLEDLAEAVLGYSRQSGPQTPPLTLLQLSRVGSLRGSFKSWYPGKSDPEGHAGILFLDSIVDRILEFYVEEKLAPPPSERIRNVFWRGTYEEFYEIIPPARRASAKLSRPKETKETEQGKDLLSTEEEASEYQALWIRPSSRSETAKDGILRGRIDQKLHYLTPSSVDHWQAVIDSEQYHQYEECKAALRKFTVERLWLDFIRTERANGAVLLGAGAPKKDFIIIKSLAEHASLDDGIYYGLVDHSYYMLEASLHAIDRMLTFGGLKGRVQLSPLSAISWPCVVAISSEQGKGRSHGSF